MPKNAAWKFLGVTLLIIYTTYKYSDANNYQRLDVNNRSIYTPVISVATL
jgi:hypothetical protein